MRCSVFQLKAEVASPDDCFLVCPLSGYCFPKNNTVNEEVSFVSCFWRVDSCPMTDACVFVYFWVSLHAKCHVLSPWARNSLESEVQNDAPPSNDWEHASAALIGSRQCTLSWTCPPLWRNSKDPELSVAQQVGRWFEQGSAVMSQASFTSWKPGAYGAHAGLNRILHEWGSSSCKVWWRLVLSIVALCWTNLKSVQSTKDEEQVGTL